MSPIFVEKQHAAMGLLEAAGTFVHAGCYAALDAEQFAFEQIARSGQRS